MTWETKPVLDEIDSPRGKIQPSCRWVVKFSDDSLARVAAPSQALAADRAKLRRPDLDVVDVRLLSKGQFSTHDETDADELFHIGTDEEEPPTEEEVQKKGLRRSLPPKAQKGVEEAQEHGKKTNSQFKE